METADPDQMERDDADGEPRVTLEQTQKRILEVQVRIIALEKQDMKNMVRVRKLKKEVSRDLKDMQASCAKIDQGSDASEQKILDRTKAIEEKIGFLITGGEGSQQQQTTMEMEQPTTELDLLEARKVNLKLMIKENEVRAFHLMHGRFHDQSFIFTNFRILRRRSSVNSGTWCLQNFPRQSGWQSPGKTT